MVKTKGLVGKVIKVTTFLEAGVPFSIKDAKFRPILANFGYYVAILRTFWCTFTGLNDVVVYQK